MSCLPNIESRVWREVIDISTNYPNASRLLSVPLALGVFVEAILMGPLGLLEIIIKIAVGFFCCLEDEYKSAMQQFPETVIACTLVTLFSPLMSIYLAAKIFALMIYSPNETCHDLAFESDKVAYRWRKGEQGTTIFPPGGPQRFYHCVDGHMRLQPSS